MPKYSVFSAKGGQWSRGTNPEPRRGSACHVLPAPHLLGNPLPRPEQVLQQQATGKAQPLPVRGPLGPSHPPVPQQALAPSLPSHGEQLPRGHPSHIPKLRGTNPRDSDQCSPCASRPGTGWEAHIKASLWIRGGQPPTPTCLDCDKCLGYSCLQTLALRGSTVRHSVRLLRSCTGDRRDCWGRGPPEEDSTTHATCPS